MPLHLESRSFSAFSQEKIIPPDELKQRVDSFRKEGKTLATLNGSFDLLHAGHLHMLYQAALQGDLLLVALNSDASVKRYKDPKRPIIALKDRLAMMSALAFVDYVTWFEADDPRVLLETVRPDVHVNGTEYGEDCIEAQVVKKHGGRIHIVSLIEGLSTSAIIARVHEICD